jgi:hypothetical protein
MKKKWRDWRQLGASELDSSGVENKDIKAHLPVPSERRGVVCGGGAMVRTLVAEAWGFLFLSFTEKKRKGRGVAARGWGRKGRALGFGDGLIEGGGSRWWCGGEDHSLTPSMCSLGWKKTTKEKKGVPRGTGQRKEKTRWAEELQRWAAGSKGRDGPQGERPQRERGHSPRG